MDQRILLVDDNELVCQQLSQLLARDERRIKVAHDGTTERVASLSVRAL